MAESLNCFKAYDIRGQIPNQLNCDIAYRIGRSYAQFLSPEKVVVGNDIRLTSEELSQALINGLTDAGVNVINIGQCGTEEVYFATSHLNADGGIVVTASHNPKDYNGMKLVRENSKPISGDNGLNDIRLLAERNEFTKLADVKGRVSKMNIQPDYIAHLLSYINVSNLKPIKIVCNAGNGGAGSIVDLLEQRLPIEFVKIHHEADGNFPNGVPNPLLIENRKETSNAIVQSGAALGIAWDGDFDRCFFFDENGRFIEGYYIVGLLAKAFLEEESGARIVHDPRLTWNTIDIVESNNGVPVLCKTGHAFIKERMRNEDAAYGGEMSAHHYFRDFFYCDSGMIPWLLVVEMLAKTGKPFSSLVDERMKAYPASGEINTQIDDPAKLLKKLELHYGELAQAVDYTDGLSLDMGEWRFNVRMSNTEPLVRLNVESKGNQELMEEKTKEIRALMV